MIFVDEDLYRDKIGIYLIRNKINGKTYVGQTSDRFIERYWNHRWKLNNNIHDNKYFQNSWNKYGEDNFEFSILYISDKNENIDDIERCFIKKYNKNSYNIQLGGQDKTMKNVKMSKETKEKIGAKNRQNMLGRKASIETKDKMSKMRSGKSNWGACKISYEEAKHIKNLLICGNRPIDISNALNIDYKIVNNIFSNNTYKSVDVEGWEEFYKNRPSYKNEIRRGLRKLNEDEVIELKKYRSDGFTQSKLCEMFGISRNTVLKYLSE